MFDSIAHVFLKSVESFPDKSAFRYRDANGNKTDISYSELYSLVNSFAAALNELGVKAGKHALLFSENRLQWFVADMALLSLGAVDVPRGTDSTTKELLEIAEHSDADILICENAKVYERMKNIHEKMLLSIILDDSLSDKNNAVYSYSDMIELGNSALDGDEDFLKRAAKGLKRDCLATIIYTSGTTGKPKGVMLEHGNILHNIEVLPPLVHLTECDRLLSILPIWHIYERMICYTTISKGALTVYSSKRTLKSDMAEDKPTIMITVPAIWINIHKTVMKKIRSYNPIKRFVADFLIKRSIKFIRAKRREENRIILYGNDEPSSAHNKKEYSCTPLDAIFHKFAKLIVYKNILALTGAELRLTISGGGALPLYVEDFLEACGIFCTVGWGITECSPVLSLRRLEHNVIGSAGKPVPFVELEIRDEQERILGSGQKGLCWVRGPNLMRGYYKDGALTSQVLKNGSFNTGDIGKETKDGQIVLLGREKETIVLLSGENVEPRPIEDAALESKFIEQIFIAGQDRKFLSALVYPSFDELKEHFGGKEVDLTDEGMKKEIGSLLKQELNARVNYESGFREFERIIHVDIIDEPFTIENGLLTQSLKMRKQLIYERYKERIDAIYHS